MSYFFSNFDRITFFSVPYKCEPLILFIRSIKQLSSLSSGENQIEIVLDQSIKLLNKIISIKEIYDEDLNKVRDACKRLRVRGYNSEIMNIAKIISDSIEFIKIDNILVKVLEELILNNSEDIYGLLVDSEDQWNYILSILQKNELHIFVKPIFLKTAREKYFNIPIITFFPSKWISELILLPPTENFFIIHHVGAYIWGVNSSIFNAPNGNSIEASTENMYLVKNNLVHIESSEDFYSKFSLFYSDELIVDADTSSFESLEQPQFKIEIRDQYNKIQYIEYNKEYLIITKDNEIKYSTFENDDQIKEIKYVVDGIDASFLSSDDLKRHQNLMMEKWKKPLREHSDVDVVIKKLEKLGAKRATAQNIRNWSTLENIAPRDYEDYKAVLLFSGITDNDEIERFFEFARKRRGSAISDGHYQRNIGLEIVKEYLENIKNTGIFELNHQVQSIKFSLIPLG